eukprot:4195742-Prorocentrum_lima.AAC.1
MGSPASSKGGPAAPKRLRAELERWEEKAKELEVEQKLKVVVEELAGDPELLATVHSLIKGGCFREKLETNSGRFHRSAGRWHELSISTLCQLLDKCKTGVDIVSLKKANSKS